MSHRIKNLFSVAGSIVALSTRGADSPEALARSVQDRLAALARAHELTLTRFSPEAPLQAATLHALIDKIVLPFEDHGGGKRVCMTGPDIPVAASCVTSLALLLHEFMANAAKYGALSVPSGRIDIECGEEDGRFSLSWQEQGGPPILREEDAEGFGSLLVRSVLKQQLGGEISREWKTGGLLIRLSFDKARVSDS